MPASAAAALLGNPCALCPPIFQTYRCTSSYHQVIILKRMERDHGLDTLLLLDGESFVVENGDVDLILKERTATP
jgi:hypothetical protein